MRDRLLPVRHAGKLDELVPLTAWPGPFSNRQTNCNLSGPQHFRSLRLIWYFCSGTRDGRGEVSTVDSIPHLRSVHDRFHRHITGLSMRHADFLDSHRLVRHHAYLPLEICVLPTHDGLGRYGKQRRVGSIFSLVRL